MKKISIIVDASPLQNTVTGIGSYVINTVNALSHKDNISFIFCGYSEIPDQTKKLIANRNVVYEVYKKKICNRILWFMFYFGRCCNALEPDYYWGIASDIPFLMSKKIKKVITIHDVVEKEFRKTMSLKNRINVLIFKSHSNFACDLVIYVSEYTKAKALYYYPVLKKKKCIVGSSYNYNLFQKKDFPNEAVQKVFQSKSIMKPYFLFVGTIEPRKNILFLLNLFKLYNQNKDYQLVIVGIKGWGSITKDKSLQTDNTDIVFTGYISSEDLLLLYNQSYCYISTSLNEGFGIPQLEAMACGIPVVSPNNSAMIEVLRNAGVLVDGWDFSAWVNALDYVKENRKLIIESQNKRVFDYNWHKYADSLNDFFLSSEDF